MIEIINTNDETVINALGKLGGILKKIPKLVVNIQKLF